MSVSLRSRLLAPLIALLLGCGPATSPPQPPAPSPPAVQIEPAPAEPTMAAEPAEPDEPLVNLILVKAFARMVDCGHDGAVGDLRCAFTAAGQEQPVRDNQALRPYLTDPPGLLLAAADWHPAHKLSEDAAGAQSQADAPEAVLAECRLERRGELSDVHLAATRGVRGWLWADTVPVATVSECTFRPHERFPRVMAAAHLLLMHNDSMRKPASLKRTRDEALLQARDAAAQLESGADLAEVVAHVSDEPGAAKRGGDLGRFRPRVMVPMFSLAVLATPIGQRTPVFETPFGFHVAERRPAGDR